MKTRMSLFYLAGYLSVGGVGFLFFPQVTLALFLSNGDYSDGMVRFVGVMMLALAILISQIIRFQVDALYPATLVARAVILPTLAWFYFETWDPMMLFLLGIVGLGFILTLVSYLMDRRVAAAR